VAAANSLGSEMTPERWPHVKSLLARVLDEDSAHRKTFLDRACGGDDTLRAEVLSLLAREQRTTSFLGRPLLASALHLRRFLRSGVTPHQPDDAPESATVSVEHIPSTGLTRRPFFFWCALVVGALFLILYSHAIWTVARYGDTTKDFGWTATRRGPDWVVASVAPGGPASDQLKKGDRLLAFNGDERVRTVGPGPHRRFVPLGGSFTVRVEREAQGSHEHALRTSSAPGRGNAAMASTYIGLSVCFCLMALMMGLLKPQSPVAKLGFVAGSAAALRLIGMGLTPYRGLDASTASLLNDAVWLIEPWQFALGYHFLFRLSHGGLSHGDARPRIWSALNRSLYVVCGLLFALNGTLFTALLIGQDALVSLAFRYPLVIDLNQLLFHSAWWSLFQLLAFTAMAAVLWHGYRDARDRDQQTRIRWVVCGGLVGLIPVAAYSLGTFLLRLSGQGELRADPLWMQAGHVASAFMVAFPAALVYAVVKHRLLDIQVAIRLSLQYLLARRVLQGVLLLPAFALLWPVLQQPDRTLAELFPLESVYLNVVLLAAVAASVWYRDSVQAWLDRKFFREAYQQETILRDTLAALKQLDRVEEGAQLVATKVIAALHPSFICIFHQVRPKGPFALSHSSGQVSDGVRRLVEPAIVRILATDFKTPRDVLLPSLERRDSCEASLMVPVIGSDERLVGLLVLGERKSEAPYSPADRRLLQGIADQIALVHENVRLRERVDEEQRVRRTVLGHLPRERIDLLRECSACGACFDADVQYCTADGHELTHLLPVERILDGRYRLDRRLGHGGMGAVYEATDLDLQRKVAAKVMLGNLFGNLSALRRFEREAQAVARLNHPNIVAVHDFGRIGADGAYLVMERIYGSTWRAELEAQGTLSPSCLAEWLAQLLDGLGAAHAARVVHRDLKPENILIVPAGADSGRIKIVDFGLATLEENGALHMSLTASGVFLGTFRYMSPEQLMRKDCDARSDLFTVGVMAFEALTGTRPFVAESPAEMLMAIEQQQFDKVWRKALSYDPCGRYQTAAEMRDHFPGELGIPPNTGSIIGAVEHA
jgi:GAF domain-containing protein